MIPFGFLNQENYSYSNSRAVGTVSPKYYNRVVIHGNIFTSNMRKCVKLVHLFCSNWDSNLHIFARVTFRTWTLPAVYSIRFSLLLPQNTGLLSSLPNVSPQLQNNPTITNRRSSKSSVRLSSAVEGGTGRTNVCRDVRSVECCLCTDMELPVRRGKKRSQVILF